MQGGIAEDSETGLMWLRFAYGKTCKNGTTVGDAKKVEWNHAIKISQVIHLNGSGYADRCDYTKQFYKLDQLFNQLGGYAGHCDWRLPTIDELKTLIDRVKGKSGNYIDTDVFPNNTACFWSSSLDAPNSAWVLYFDNGNDDNCNKKNHSAVRLVRGNTIDKPAGNQIHSAAKVR